LFSSSFSFFWSGLDWNCNPPNLSLPQSLGWQAYATMPGYLLKWSLATFLLRLTWDWGPLNLSLLDCYGYRCELLACG
jgi:hypothetical protein